MKLEEIGTKYIVAEDIFPKVENRVSEFYFFRNEESAWEFYREKISEFKDKINQKEFIGFDTKTFHIVELKNSLAMICEEDGFQGGYSLRLIDNN